MDARRLFSILPGIIMGAFFAAAVILKIGGFIDWQWRWIFGAIWIPIVVSVCIISLMILYYLLIVFCVGALAVMKQEHKRQKAEIKKGASDGKEICSKD